MLLMLFMLEGMDVKVQAGRRGRMADRYQPKTSASPTTYIVEIMQDKLAFGP